MSGDSSDDAPKGIVLLTGGTGFLAWHILARLLEERYKVVTTARSDEKGEALLEHIPDAQRSLVSYVVVESISKPDAFDECVRNIPSLDYVLHTASPVTFDVKDVMKDVIDPALNGATGILASVAKYGPSVKRVVLTSSTAAVVTPGMEKLYDESDFCAASIEVALANPALAYRTSKSLAERAAWDFMEETKRSFDLAVINNTWTFGAIPPHLSRISQVNASNERIKEMVTGGMRNGIRPTAPVFTWVDAADVATAHVRAMLTKEAGGKRFVIAGGNFSNKMLVDIIREKFPQLREVLPPEGQEDDIGDQVSRLDNTRSREILGMEYGSLEKSVEETVQSMLRLL